MHRIVIVVPFLSFLLSACPPGGLGSTPEGLSGASSGGGEVSGQCTADMGADAAAQKLEAFLLATSKFVGTAGELEGSLLDTCKRMGSELDMKDADYAKGSPNEPEVRSVCNAVSAKLSAELSDLKVQGNLRIKVRATPPVCEVSMNAYAKCAADCQVDVDPGQVELKCEGGEIVGRCEGECKGACHAEVDGQCSGVCEGSCSGGCKGTCEGECKGKCATRGEGGLCNGACDGTCEGTCSAGCQGSCKGECVVSAKADCNGECHGGCSVEYTEPRCTGKVRPPKLDADCKASCDARLNAEAKCKPGHAEVAVKGDVKSNVEAKLARVSAAIRIGYADVAAIREKLKLLEASGKLMVNTAADVPKAAGSLGAAATACAIQAAAAIPRAVAQVSVSVDVSVSVSASASGSAGG